MDILSSGGVEEFVKRTSTEYIVPTGVDVIDHFLLYRGGFPTGIVAEISGWEGSGKTTLVMNIAKNTQQMGGVVLLADIEPWDIDRMQQIGIQTTPDKLLVIKGEFIEERFANLIKAITNLQKVKDIPVPITVIFDSIALGITRKELNAIVNDNENAPIAAKAQVLTTRLALVENLIRNTPILFIFVNQFRQKLEIKVPWLGGGISTPGGHALRYAASVRLYLQAGKSYEEEYPLGYIVTVSVEKNKVAPPLPNVTYLQYYNGSFGNWWSIIESGVAMDVIQQNRGWYSYNNKSFRKNSQIVNEPFYEEMRQKVIEAWHNYVERIYSPNVSTEQGE